MRWQSELAYSQFIEETLPKHEFLGELTAGKLLYYPTVTREPFRNQGRITDLIEAGRLCADLGLPPLDPETDRAMICGSPAMNRDMCELLDARGFKVSRTSAHRAITSSSGPSSRSEYRPPGAA